MRSTLLAVDVDDEADTGSASALRAKTGRTFLIVAITGSLVAWDIGFEWGAFETVSYRRIFVVFVVSTVVLIATLVADDDSFATSAISRVILALPIAYVIADVTYLTESDGVVRVLEVSMVVTFPYAVYVIGRLLDQDYFLLPRREQIYAAVTVILIGLLGWYVGQANDRFLFCSDFERVGDFVPENCAPG